MTRSYRFLRTPKWIVLVVLVTALVAFMLSLSRWQFDRLDERILANSTMTAGLVIPSEPVTHGSIQTAEWVFRRVSAEGEYSLADQILVEGRSLNNDPGLWIMTPFDLTSGGSVLVMRGWVGVGDSVSEPPSGLIDLAGVLIPGEEQRNVGPQDNADTDVFTRVDLGLIGAKTERALGAAYLQLTTTDSTLNSAPTILAQPAVEGEGRHKGYAIQWLGFSLTAVIGLFALVRNEAGKRADG